MQKIRAVGVAMALGALLVGGCRQPQEQSAEPPVPPGSIPAAPDVRPGTESAPGGVAPSGGEGVAGDQAMPSDTVQPGTTVTGVDTVGMRRP
ncbi:hypothetical protein BH23GEM6_BH23GEM6_00210 [soil metagenome]